MNAPRKRFGQNFLHDKGVIGRIIDCMHPGPDDHFVEIGPGRGAITRELAQQAGQLDVIEIDRDLAADLQQQTWVIDSNVKIHCADALAFDFETLATNGGKLRLAGNLPYNISTPLLFHLLQFHHLFTDLHVMLQKEVVQRMTAPPGSKTYGRLSVALAARCEVEALFTIGAGAFTPAPKVESAFARLVPLSEALVDTEDLPAFDAILRAAFGQRRKQLGNALGTLLSPAAIESAGVDPSLRAENLSTEAFVALGRELHSQRTAADQP